MQRAQQVKPSEQAPVNAPEVASPAVGTHNVDDGKLSFLVRKSVSASQEAGLFVEPQPSATCMAFTPSCFRKMVTAHIATAFADHDVPWKAAFAYYGSWKFQFSSLQFVRVLTEADLGHLVKASRLVSGNHRQLLADIVTMILQERVDGRDYLTENEFFLWVGMQGTTSA